MAGSRGHSACGARGFLEALGRTAIGHARVTCAIGHSIDGGVAAEREGGGSGAADGPATFARREVKQRTRLGADDIVGNRRGCKKRFKHESLSQDLRPPDGTTAARSWRRRISVT